MVRGQEVRKMPHPVMGLGLFFLGTAADFQFAVEVFQYLRATETGNQGFLRAH